jgi:hypothetical protein
MVTAALHLAAMISVMASLQRFRSMFIRLGVRSMVEETCPDCFREPRDDLRNYCSGRLYQSEVLRRKNRWSSIGIADFGPSRLGSDISFSMPVKFRFESLFSEPKLGRVDPFDLTCNLPNCEETDSRRIATNTMSFGSVRDFISVWVASRSKKVLLLPTMERVNQS